MLVSRERLLAEAAKCDIVCANCHRVRTRHALESRPPGQTGNSAGLERKRARWRAQARLLDALRDRPCADCGGRYPPCAMDFDHVHGATKAYTVTRMVGRAGDARVLAEVAKCDIVCANCHRARTFDRRLVGSGGRE